MSVKPFLIVACIIDDDSRRALDSLRDRDLYADLSAEDIPGVLEVLPSDLDVIIVSDEPSVLRAHCDRPGLLPILFASESNFSCSHTSWVELNCLKPLLHLFDESLTSLRSLLRLDVVEIRKQQNSVKGRFLDAVRNANGLYIFGAGTIGSQIVHECQIKNVRVKGFVDNNPERQGDKKGGLPICDPIELDVKKEVVVVAVGNHAQELDQQLSNLGFQHIFNLSQFFYALSSSAQPEIGYLDDIYENRYHWFYLALHLQDDRSREVISAILRHRLSLETKYLAAVKDVGVVQWFDPRFIKKSEQAVFVDGGAFDGDTSEVFREINGPAKRIHAFEPDPELAALAKSRLSVFKEVLVHPQGLSDGSARVNFMGSGITDSRIDSSATSGRTVDVVSIDDVVSEPITYLKLDIEGAENLAIVGATNQININSPVIGLAVYHKPSDPWRLTEQLSRLKTNYRYYMRHYTDVAFETVVYAIPDGELT